MECWQTPAFSLSAEYIAAILSEFLTFFGVLCDVLTQSDKIRNLSTESANFWLKLPHRESPGQPSAVRDFLLCYGFMFPGKRIIPTRSPKANTKQISYGGLFCGIVSVLVIQELWCIIISVVMWLSRVIDWRKTKLYWYYSAVLFKLQYTFKKYTHYYTKACDVDFLLRETPNAPEQLKQYWKISLPPTLTK